MALYQLSYWPTQRGQKDSGDGCPWEPIQSADLARFPRRSERRRRGGGPCRTAPRAVHLTAAPPAAPRSGRAPGPTSNRDTPAGPRSRRGRGGRWARAVPHEPGRAKGARSGGLDGPRSPATTGRSRRWATSPWKSRRSGNGARRSPGNSEPWRFGARASRVAFPDEAARPRPCGSPPNPWPPSRGGRRSLTETRGCAHPTVDAPRPGETAGFRPSEGPTPSHFARSASLQGRPSGRFATGSSFTLRPP